MFICSQIQIIYIQDVSRKKLERTIFDMKASFEQQKSKLAEQIEFLSTKMATIEHLNSSLTGYI